MVSPQTVFFTTPVTPSVSIGSRSDRQPCSCDCSLDWLESDR